MKKGHVTRKKGRKLWYYVVDVERDPQTGRRKQQWSHGFKTKDAAQRALNEVINRLDRNEYVAPSKMTVAEFLNEKWLPAIKANLRPTTLALRELAIRSYITPHIGGVRLQRLDPADLNGLYARLLESGSVRGKGGRPLSTSMVRNVHVTLRKALGDALKWGYVTRNAAAVADPPKTQSGEMDTWTPDELGTFLRSVENDRLYAAYLLPATTGMRRAEVLGLTWRNLDLDAGRLAVTSTLHRLNKEFHYGSPKTERARRSVPIPPETVAALRSHKARQATERLELGPDYSPTDLVFCEKDGTPLTPATFSRRFQKLAKAAGLRVIRFHDLRHTWATLALQAGIPPKVVSEILGHSSIAITLDRYTHAVPSMQEDAVDRVAALFMSPRPMTAPQG